MNLRHWTYAEAPGFARSHQSCRGAQGAERVRASSRRDDSGAFILHPVEGLDFKEIAVIAGTTESTARVRAHRARLLLQSDLGAVFATFTGLSSTPR